MSAEHRPLPWKCELMGSEGWSVFASGGFGVYPRTIATNLSEADARFVVQACNAHEELLEAAKALLNVIDTMTTDDFARGLEQPEREVLRIAIKAAGG